jgi:hypothetical protein
MFSPRLFTDQQRTPPRLPLTFFGWLMPVINITDRDFLEKIGLDGYVVLRFLKFGATMSMTLGIFGMITLVPIYTQSHGQVGIVGFQKLTVANVTLNGESLWATVIFTYLYTLIYMYLLDKEYQNFAIIRQELFENGDSTTPKQVGASILVENIPPKYRSSQMIFELLDGLFPGLVLFANINVDIGPLDAAIASRTNHLNYLEHEIAWYEGHPEKLRPVKMISGKEVDTISHYDMRLNELNEKVAALQQDARAVYCSTESLDNISIFKAIESTLDDKINVSDKAGTAFVTFKSYRARLALLKSPVIFTGELMDILAYPAPAPSEMIWENVTVLKQTSEDITLFTNRVLVLGFFIWAFICILIALSATFDNLSGLMPWIQQIPFLIKTILAAQLPVQTLMLFTGYLERILTWIATSIEKRKSLSEVHETVFLW